MNTYKIVVDADRTEIVDADRVNNNETTLYLIVNSNDGKDKIIATFQRWDYYIDLGEKVNKGETAKKTKVATKDNIDDQLAKALDVLFGAFSHPSGQAKI